MRSAEQKNLGQASWQMPISRRTALKLIAAGIAGAILPAVGCSTPVPERIEFDKLKEAGILVTPIGGHKLLFQIRTDKWEAGNVQAKLQDPVDQSDTVHWVLTFQRISTKETVPNNFSLGTVTNVYTSKDTELEFKFINPDGTVVATVTEMSLSK